MSIIDNIKNAHILPVWIEEMTTFSQWFGLFFSITLNILIVFFIGLLISGFFKNIYFIQTLNLLLVLIFIILGDFFIDMNYSMSTYTIIISYFVPQKYVTWINYIFYTKSDKHYYNFFKIIPLPDYKLSFTSIYQPVFSVLGFIVLFATSSYFAFLHGTKK